MTKVKSSVHSFSLGGDAADKARRAKKGISNA